MFVFHMSIAVPSPASKVALPYIRAKAQDYYESLGGGVDQSIVDESNMNEGSRQSPQAGVCCGTLHVFF